MVCKETLSCPEHGFLFPDEVSGNDNERRCSKCGKSVIEGRVEKMSKSKKNVIDPNQLLDRYGADTTRLFCLFAAPPERDLEWSEQGVDGGYRFLNRVWRLAYTWMDSVKDQTAFCGNPEELEEPLKGVYKKTHETIRRVTGDIEERFHFNTAISAVMELVNTMYTIDAGCNLPEKERVMRFAMESTVLLLSPIVPHFAEEIWAALGHPDSVFSATWPLYRQDALQKDELLIVVQVNGKLRSRFQVGADTDEKTIRTLALADERVQKFIGDAPVKKVIVVQKKLVNIVL